MGSLIHREFDVTVVAVYPFGLSVEFDDGTEGLIDNTKDPDWRGGSRGDVIGNVVHVVVLDDERDPVRVSALESDWERGRQAQRDGEEIFPIDADYIRERRERGTL